MGLRHAIGDVIAISDGIWRTRLTPADVRRIGEGTKSVGRTSILGVTNADFDANASLLHVDPDATTVFNIGSSDEAILVTIGADETRLVAGPALKSGVHALFDASLGRGDNAFIRECEQHLNAELVEMARTLLSGLRGRYSGNMQEGKARKWVNHPGNFLAITIQNRDQSLAVHLKGEPSRFDAPGLDLKRDRPSYSRFKLAHSNQLGEAIRAVLMSAQISEGY